MGRKNTKRLITAILIAIVAPLLSAQSNSEQADSLVRLLNATFIEQFESPSGEMIRKAVKATFLHNGTYLNCDSSLWYTDKKIINCIGNVQLMQGDTYLTSDKLDYLIDEDLAQFRGSLVQLTNENDNILRTRILDYNTKDSLAVFSGGASMRSEDGQIIESDDGSYSSADKLFTFRGNVSMYADSTFIRTSLLTYASDPQLATFPEYVDFWREGNMLSSGNGWYDRYREIFFFKDNVHGLGETQETWSDSLYYYRNSGNILMLGKAQVQDTTKSAASLSDFLFYEDSLSMVTLRRNAAIASWSENNGQIDTTYMGADTLIYQGVRHCDIPESTFGASESRKKLFNGDPVAEFRHRAAEEAAKAKEEEMKNMLPANAKASGNKDNKKAERTDKDLRDNAASVGSAGDESAGLDSLGVGSERAGADSLAMGSNLIGADSLAMGGNLIGADSLAVRRDSVGTNGLNLKADADSLAVGADSLRVGLDSLAVGRDSLGLRSDSLAVGRDSLGFGSDSLGFGRDSLGFNSDSLGFGRDSLGFGSDSLAKAEVLDTTRIAFVRGIGNVKVFRSDMQVKCDSLSFSELDSIVLLYKNPIVWNEGIRQYRSDSLFVLIGKDGIDKANLISNAFITIYEDSTHFDQIKSLEVMAYFNSEGNLSRFDALGGANAIFYIKENEQLATVNKVETKMLSATMKDGELERTYYFQSPKNDAYPVVQLPDKEQQLKGFSWEPESRPKSRYEISSLKLRASEREYYSAKPKAEFPRTDHYFPGYIEDLRENLEEIRIRKQIMKERKDSSERANNPALMTPTDSISIASDSLKVSSDSLAINKVQIDSSSVAAQTDSLSTKVADTKEDPMMSERELREAMRIAERDARWRELDRRDAEREAEKKAKEAARQKRREERAAARIAKMQANEEALLQKYIKIYEKRKAKEEARAKAKAKSKSKAKTTIDTSKVKIQNLKNLEKADSETVVHSED